MALILAPAGVLHQEISKYAPINGVSVGRRTDRSTWRIDFNSSATLAQKNDANRALAAFDMMTALATTSPKDPFQLLIDRVTALEAKVP